MRYASYACLVRIIKYHIVAETRAERLAVLGPLVLAADLVFLLRREVVLDIERLADLVGGLALDHVRDGLATDVEKGLDVEVICGLCLR